MRVPHDRLRRRALLMFAVALWVVMGIAASGCGPSLYTARLWPARRAVERARDAGAEARAPYLYWYAVAHLDKAQEEAGESSYQRAARYAGRAREAAEAAEAVARRARDVESAVPASVAAATREASP